MTEQGRSPPHNFEAEMALLGAIMSNNKAYHRVSEFLRPDHFADPRNGAIFEVMATLIDRGQVADPITIKEYFEDPSDPRFDLHSVGGMAYIATLASKMISVINVGDYGHTIHDRWLRRELISAGEDLVNAAHDMDLALDAHQLVDAAMTSIVDVMDRGRLAEGGTDLKASVWGALDRVEAAYKADGAITGLPTGLSRLDGILGGFHRGDLIVAAGRPGMGKTDFAVNVCRRAAQHLLDHHIDEQILFFSLEMTHEELSHRLLAGETAISAFAQRRGQVEQDDFARLMQAASLIEQLPLVVDDTPGLNVNQMKARARRYQSKRPLALIVIDHLNRTGKINPRSNRYEHITETATGSKDLAKSLHTPVLLLSQLSRDVEQRDNKRPDLPDLRESGAIEQEADVVMFLYREAYYLAKVPKEKRDYAWDEAWTATKNLLELIIAKQRMGPIATIEARYEPQNSLITNLGGAAPVDDAQSDLSF